MDNIERIKEYLTNVKLDQVILKNADISENVDYIKCEFEITTKRELNMICDSYYGYYIEESEDSWKVGILLPKSGQLFFDEYDRSPDAFNLFKSIYGDALTEDKEGWKYRYIENKSIAISGDIDINFKMRTLRSWFEIIDNDPNYKEDKDSIKNKLWGYHDLTYTPQNISLMPVSGGMNNFKENIGFDRIDTFLFALKLYYEDKVDSIILNYGQINPANSTLKKNLKGYLDSFGSVYNYCSEIYHIDDKKFIDNLCKNGKKAILSVEDIEKYLKLATGFWKKKEDFYRESQNSDVKTNYQKMIKKHCEIIGNDYINTFNVSNDYHC